MKTLRRFLCVVLALAMSLGICSSFAYAKATVTDVKILTPPSKTTFYKGSDWDYGIWQASGEEEEIYWQWESGKKISFLKNAGSGLYPERGMIDMSGLVIEVTYSDKTKKTIAYKETKNSKGIVVANILVSPVKGEFYVGKNKLDTAFLNIIRASRLLIFPSLFISAYFLSFAGKVLSPTACMSTKRASLEFIL